MPSLTRSIWLKVLVTVVAAGGLLALYQATTRDAVRLDPSGRAAPGAGISVSATAYCKGTTTASGVAVQRGAAASDPSILPLGSVVEIDTGDPRYDGMYTILDTGPAVKGKEVDIYIWSCHEALEFGRKQVQVTVLRQGWDPRATPGPSQSFFDRIFKRPTSEPALPPSPSRPLPQNP